MCWTRGWQQQNRAEVLWECGGFSCHLNSNLLHPQVPGSGCGCSANSQSCTCPAEPDLYRGHCGFIKCLSLDKIWDNTVLLCLVEPWLQQCPCVCQASTSVLPVPPLSVAGHKGTPGLIFLSNSAWGEGECRGSNRVSISAAAAPFPPEALSDIRACRLSFVALYHSKHSVFISSSFLSLNSSFPTSMLCMP